MEVADCRVAVPIAGITWNGAGVMGIGTRRGAQ